MEKAASWREQLLHSLNFLSREKRKVISNIGNAQQFVNLIIKEKEKAAPFGRKQLYVRGYSRY
jgi:hypothetical protein